MANRVNYRRNEIPRRTEHRSEFRWTNCFKPARVRRDEEQARFDALREEAEVEMERCA